MPRTQTRTVKPETTAARRVTRAVKTARKPRAAGKPREQAAGGGVTHEQIAMRAYEIHLSGTAGDALEHWLRAERELTEG